MKLCVAFVVAIVSCAPQTPPPARRPVSVSAAPSSSTAPAATRAWPKLASKSTKYPMRFERSDEAEIAALEKLFRERNPEPWTSVTIDPYGLLYEARIVGPTPTEMPKTPEYDDAKMAEKWSAFLERNRDALGLDAPGFEPTPTKHRAVGWVQLYGHQFIGTAQVSWHGVGYSNGFWSPAGISVVGHGWPVNFPQPEEKTDDQLAAAYVGTKGTLHTSYMAHSQPCDPPGGTFNPCANQKQPVAPPPTQKPYTIARDELLVQRGPCHYHRKGDDAVELRVAARITIRLRVIHTTLPGSDIVVGTSGFVPNTPLPARIDAITGEDLSAGRCGDESI
jgi:hypothetical protein